MDDAMYFLTLRVTMTMTVHLQGLRAGFVNHPVLNMVCRGNRGPAEWRFVCRGSV